MKKLLTAAMTSAIALTAMGGAASAQDRGDRREWRQEQREERREERRERRRERREDQREWRSDRHERAEDRREHRERFQDRRDFERWVQAQRRYQAGAWYAPRGYRHQPYRYGQYLPPVYRTRSYVIYDPYRYRLAPAPYGYAWHRIGNDAVLVSLTTGLVASVVSGLFY